ncbi:MAG: hypothetical protein IMF11_07985 [Proteobacteria bacterium]|nr:hypothetical protein [Pseudomonadota bacterium]
MEKILDIYFRFVIEALARLSPPFSYWALPCTGHLMRDWKAHSSAMSPGALISFQKNLLEVLRPDRSELRKMVREYLRLESRYVMETYG